MMWWVVTEITSAFMLHGTILILIGIVDGIAINVSDIRAAQSVVEDEIGSFTGSTRLS